MKTILYTSPDETDNEIELISELFDLGLDYLYIIKPNLDDFSLVDFVEKIPEKYWSKCISNSLIITKEFDLAGYHFTQDIIQKNDKYNQKILDWLHQSNKISSVSAHSIDELKLYQNKYKHIFILPILKSISKADYSYNWNFDELLSILSHADKNLSSYIASGGIDASSVHKINNLPIEGIGLLGAIWSKTNSIEAKNEFCNILIEINKK